MALALPEDGQLFALEKDSEALEVAQRHWQDANVGSKIKVSPLASLTVHYKYLHLVRRVLCMLP